MIALSSRGIVHLTIFLALVCGYALSSALAKENAPVHAKFFSTLDDSTVIVPSDRVGMLVEHFHMGNGSRIKLSAETPLFFIRAKSANIGDGTYIVFKGKDGSLPGEHGMHALTLILIVENVESLKGLTIEGTGGSGADGKRGSKGSPGRAASCGGSGAGNGGRGGAGTPGGNAGNGGNFFAIVPTHARHLFEDRVSPKLEPGRSGNGGLGGPGGDGGRGKKRCGVWPYWKRGAGNPGPSGPNGPNGQEGRTGLVQIYDVSSFHKEIISEKLEDIISKLNEAGYSDVSSTLRSVVSTAVQPSD